MSTFLFPISYFMLSLLYKIRSNVKEKYDKHRIVQRSVTFVGQGLLYFDRAIKNYYDSKEDIALATEDIETCETYVAKLNMIFLMN